MIAYLPDGNNSLKDYRDFAEVDFIVTDLDGTLIDGDTPILLQIRNSLEKLKRKHTRITIATGRTYFGAMQRIKEIGVETGMPIALYNGGLVTGYRTGDIFYASYVPTGILKDLLGLVCLDYAGVYAYTFSVSPWIVSDTDSIIREQVFAWGSFARETDVNGLPVNFPGSLSELDTKEISAVLVDTTYLPDEEKEKIGRFLDGQSNIKVTNSGNSFIEIKGCGLNKGVICDILKKNDKFLAKRILAIGDNDNDVDLFDSADISVAVANSSESALKTADYVCDNKCAKGFADMLDVIVRAKRYYQGE